AARRACGGDAARPAWPAGRCRGGGCLPAQRGGGVHHRSSAGCGRRHRRMTREAVLPHPDARLVDAATGTVLEGSLLAGAVAAAAERYAALPPGPVLALMPTRLPAVVAYLGAFTARRPVALLDPTLPADTLADLVARYRPTVVTGVEARADAAPPPG